MAISSTDTVNVFLHDTPHSTNYLGSPITWLIVIFLLVLALLCFKRIRNILKNIRPSEYEVSLAGFKISGKLQYYSIDQEVAWKIYIELITRVSGNRLPEDAGILRESLNSLYSVFGVLRNLLKDSGAQLARSPKRDSQFTVATLLLEIMNKKLRPFLSEWHPKLEIYEKTKAEDLSQSKHEEGWDQNKLFRLQLSSLQDGLEEYINALKEIAEGKMAKL